MSDQALVFCRAQEMFDSMLDFVSYYLTLTGGGFDFINDPDKIMARAVLAIAVVTLVFFIAEVVFKFTTSIPASILGRYFLMLHILVEDGLQLILYTITAASTTASSTSDVPTGVILAILQGLIFFSLKTYQISKSAQEAVERFDEEGFKKRFPLKRGRSGNRSELQA